MKLLPLFIVVLLVACRQEQKQATGVTDTIIEYKAGDRPKQVSINKDSIPFIPADTVIADTLLKPDTVTKPKPVIKPPKPKPTAPKPAKPTTKSKPTPKKDSAR